jgi:hypothetical protein
MKGFRCIGVVGLTALFVGFFAFTPAHAAPFGTAVVVAGDGPDNCLRIRTGPGRSYSVVGCAGLGTSLELTGTTDNEVWIEISWPVVGWVYGPQTQITVASYVPPLDYVVPDPYIYGPSYRYPYRYWRYGSAYPWGVYKRGWNRPYPYVYRNFRRNFPANVGAAMRTYGYRGYRSPAGVRAATVRSFRGAGVSPGAFHRGSVGVRSGAINRGAVGLQPRGIRSFSGNSGRVRRR